MSNIENQAGQNLNRSFGDEAAMTPSERFKEDIPRHFAQNAPSIPDNPPCDGCLQLFCGTMQCLQCGSAFYCCRDCQVSHCKSGHKAECDVLQRLNEAKAQ
jgi:hypothetical protein